MRLQIQKGTPVATVFRSGAMAAVAFMGVMACGRVLVPMDARLAANRLQESISKAVRTALISDSTYVLGNANSIVTIPVHDPWDYFAQLCGRHRDFAHFSHWRDDIWVGEISIESVSSGLPIGVALSEHSLLAAATAVSSAYQLSTRNG